MCVIFVQFICRSSISFPPTQYYPQAATRRPPSIYLTSPRKQYFAARGWIPPKEHSYTSVIEPPSPPSTYNAHPITPQDTMARNTLRNWRQTLIILRTVQCLLAIIYFILLAYSAKNHGWWMVSNLSMPMGFGCASP